MSYEIPQKLQYEEKIIFNLTFKQLVYAMLFLTPALYIFMKTPFGYFTKIILCSPLICLAVLFMFFNLQGLIKGILFWFKFREAKINDEKMKDYLGIERIEKGVIQVRKE